MGKEIEDEIDLLTLAAAMAHTNEKIEEIEHEIADLGLKVVDGKLCAVYGTD